MIEQTEALFSIDVNGGQCMLGQGTSQEKAILDVNLAAARQVRKAQILIYILLLQLISDVNILMYYSLWHLRVFAFMVCSISYWSC